MDASALRRSMRLSITEGALATAMGSVLSGVVITGFALALGASPFEIGLLAALPTLCNFAQLAGAWLLGRSVDRKRLCVGTLWLGRLAWTPLLAVALLLPREHDRLLVALLIAVVGLSNVLFAIGGVAWLSWIKDLIPCRQRVGFLAARNQVDTFLSLFAGIGVSLLVDLWSVESSQSLGGFVAAIALAVGCGLAGMPLLARIPDEAPPQVRLAEPLDSFGAPLRDRNFRRLVTFYSAWNLAANCATPFFAVFMLEHLQMKFWQVTGLFALGSFAGLLASRFWSRLATRCGIKPVVLIASVGDAAFPLAWFFVEPAWQWTLPLVYALGLFGSPVAVGGNSLMMKITPQRGASSYFAVFNSIVGPAAALAAIAGGLVLQGIGDWTAAVGPFQIGGLKALFAFSAAGRLASLLLLRKVAEPGAASVAATLRALTDRLPARAGLASSERAPPALPAAAMAKTAAEPARVASTLAVEPLASSLDGDAAIAAVAG